MCQLRLRSPWNVFIQYYNNCCKLCTCFFLWIDNGCFPQSEDGTAKAVCKAIEKGENEYQVRKLMHQCVCWNAFVLRTVVECIYIHSFHVNVITSGHVCKRNVFLWKWVCFHDEYSLCIVVEWILASLHVYDKWRCMCDIHGNCK